MMHAIVTTAELAVPCWALALAFRAERRAAKAEKALRGHDMWIGVSQQVDVALNEKIERLRRDARL